MDVSLNVLVISLRAESGVIFLGGSICLSGALCWVVKIIPPNNPSLASVAKSPQPSLYLARLMLVVMASLLLPQKLFPCKLS